MDAALRGSIDRIERVAAAAWTFRLASDVFADCGNLGRGPISEFILERPGVFGAFDLTEIVDAGIEASSRTRFDEIDDGRRGSQQQEESPKKNAERSPFVRHVR